MGKGQKGNQHTTRKGNQHKMSKGIGIKRGKENSIRRAKRSRHRVSKNTINLTSVESHMSGMSFDPRTQWVSVAKRSREESYSQSRSESESTFIISLSKPESATSVRPWMFEGPAWGTSETWATLEGPATVDAMAWPWA